MNLIHTRPREPSGPHIVVPDNPWSTIYAQASIRAAAQALETGADDRLAWRAYLDADPDREEAVRSLEVTAKVYGSQIRTKRRKTSEHIGRQ